MLILVAAKSTQISFVAISERNVSKGLRRTLLTQAQRLEQLAARRLADFAEQYPVEKKGEETGEEVAE